MNRVWFTADTHFGHTNIIKYCNRPFSNAGEMDRAIIDNWNKVVAPDDSVYHLGDFCFKTYYGPQQYLSKLNGNLWVVYGNHDKQLQRFFRGGGCHSGIKCGILPAEAKICINGQEIILSHYSMRVWNKSHHGTWQLYGHSHGTLFDDPNMLSIDVGVDSHHFFPICFEQIKAIMSKKTFKPIDHHGKKS